MKGIKAESAVPAIQLSHAGRKCCVPGEDIIAPSAINFDPSDPEYVTPPREMSTDDMDCGVKFFINAARRSAEAGFEILEIHGAHGYLISEFLSPLTNARTDAFGGNMDHRAEFLKRIVKAIRSVWKKENPLFLRISGMDYADGGNRSEDLAQAVNQVKSEGVDVVHVSSGRVVPHAVVPVGPSYQIPSARVINDLTELPFVGGGLITTFPQAEGILSSGDADMVFFGRHCFVIHIFLC